MAASPPAPPVVPSLVPSAPPLLKLLMASLAAETGKVDVEVGPLVSEDEGMISVADDGAGVGRGFRLRNRR